MLRDIVRVDDQLLLDASAMLRRLRALAASQESSALGEAIRGEIDGLEIALLSQDLGEIDQIVNNDRPGARAFARWHPDEADIRSPITRNTLDWLATGGAIERPRMAFVLDIGDDFNALDDGHRARAAIARQACDRLGMALPPVENMAEARFFYGAIDDMVDAILTYAQEDNVADYDECRTGDGSRTVVIAPRAWLDVLAANRPAAAARRMSAERHEFPNAVKVTLEEGFFQAARAEPRHVPRGAGGKPRAAAALAQCCAMATTRNDLGEDVIFHCLSDMPDEHGSGILPTIEDWMTQEQPYASFGDLVRMGELASHYDNGTTSMNSTEIGSAIRDFVNYACLEADSVGPLEAPGGQTAPMLHLFDQYDAARTRAYPYVNKTENKEAVFLMGPAGVEVIRAAVAPVSVELTDDGSIIDEVGVDESERGWIELMRERYANHDNTGYRVRPMDTVRVDPTDPHDASTEVSETEQEEPEMTP